MDKAKAFIAREWAMLSTRLGTVLVVVSTAAPYLAPIHVHFAYAGALAGVLLIFYRGKTDGN